MPRQADLVFAKIVALNNLLSKEQIQECLSELERLESLGQKKSIEEIFRTKGYLSERQIQKICSARDLHLLIQEDRQYARLCVQQGFITKEQAEECLAIQKQNQYRLRLYQILVQKGYLTSAQHNQVLFLLKPKQEDQESVSDPLAKLALEQGFVSREQVKECLEIQKQLRQMGIEKSLKDVLLDKRYLSPHQAQRLLCQLGQEGQKDRVSQIVAVTTPPPQPAVKTPEKKAKKSGIEGFEILAKLGQGAMGVIYKARWVKTGEIIALKVLLPDFAENPEFVQRFLREARAATRLDHPNIARGFGAGESGGYYYYAMEYVEGVTLKQLIRKKGKLEEKEAIRIVLQVCRALEHAQEQGIVHRDIKPDNIMITSDGIAKLCDFGIAKEIDQEGSLTQTGVALGTPYYISPEQAMGEKKIDTRSDIYSLGATFYHMVTGQVPYEGDTSAVIMTKHISEPPPDPRKVNPSLSPAVAEVILKMMAKDRAYRYQTPLEVIRDLEKILRGEVTLETSSSVFVQNGMKIPTGPVTLSQIGKVPKHLKGVRKSVVGGIPPYRSPRKQKVFSSSPSPLGIPFLAIVLTALVVAIGVLAFVVFFQ